MAFNICKNWIQKLDKCIIKEKLKIALIFDNCPAHLKEINEKFNYILNFFLFAF